MLTCPFCNQVQISRQSPSALDRRGWQLPKKMAAHQAGQPHRRLPQVLWWMPCDAWLISSDSRCLHSDICSILFAGIATCNKLGQKHTMKSRNHSILLLLLELFRGHLFSVLGALLASPSGLEAVKDASELRSLPALGKSLKRSGTEDCY